MPLNSAINPLILTDINECEEGTHNCSNFARCVDMPLGYGCECRIGYEGDGVTCTGTRYCQDHIINLIMCS